MRTIAGPAGSGWACALCFGSTLLISAAFPSAGWAKQLGRAAGTSLVQPIGQQALRKLRSGIERLSLLLDEQQQQLSPVPRLPARRPSRGTSLAAFLGRTCADLAACHGARDRALSCLVGNRNIRALRRSQIQLESGLEAGVYAFGAYGPSKDEAQNVAQALRQVLERTDTALVRWDAERRTTHALKHKVELVRDAVVATEVEAHALGRELQRLSGEIRDARQGGGNRGAPHLHRAQAKELHSRALALANRLGEVIEQLGLSHSTWSEWEARGPARDRLRKEEGPTGGGDKGRHPAPKFEHERLEATFVRFLAGPVAPLLGDLVALVQEFSTAAAAPSVSARPSPAPAVRQISGHPHEGSRRFVRGIALESVYTATLAAKYFRQLELLDSHAAASIVWRASALVKVYPDIATLSANQLQQLRLHDLDLSEPHDRALALRVLQLDDSERWKPTAWQAGEKSRRQERVRRLFGEAELESPRLARDLINQLLAGEGDQPDLGIRVDYSISPPTAGRKTQAFATDVYARPIDEPLLDWREQFYWENVVRRVPATGKDSIVTQFGGSAIDAIAEFMVHNAAAYWLRNTGRIPYPQQEEQVPQLLQKRGVRDRGTVGRKPRRFALPLQQLFLDRDDHETGRHLAQAVTSERLRGALDRLWRSDRSDRDLRPNFARWLAAQSVRLEQTKQHGLALVIGP